MEVAEESSKEIPEDRETIIMDLRDPKVVSSPEFRRFVDFYYDNRNGTTRVDPVEFLKIMTNDGELGYFALMNIDKSDPEKVLWAGAMLEINTEYPGVPVVWLATATVNSEFRKRGLYRENVATRLDKLPKVYRDFFGQDPPITFVTSALNFYQIPVIASEGLKRGFSPYEGNAGEIMKGFTSLYISDQFMALNGKKKWVVKTDTGVKLIDEKKENENTWPVLDVQAIRKSNLTADEEGIIKKIVSEVITIKPEVNNTVGQSGREVEELIYRNVTLDTIEEICRLCRESNIEIEYGWEFSHFRYAAQK